MRLSLSPFTSKVAFGAKRTSTGRHNWLNRGGACCGLACAGEALGPPRRTQARGGCLMSSQFFIGECRPSKSGLQ